MRNTLSFAVVCRVATNVVGVIVAFAGLHLYNVYLTKEAYGTVMVANQFLGYLPLLSGGFGTVIGQRMLAARERETMEKNARLYQILQTYLLLAAFVVGLILMVVYSQTPAARSAHLPAALFYGVLGASVIGLYGAGQSGMLVCMGRQTDSVILSGVFIPLGLFLLWGGFRLHLGIWAMPISALVGSLLFIPTAWFLQRRAVTGLPFLRLGGETDFWPTLLEIWRPSVAWLESRVCIMLMFTVDIILMGLMFGPGAAAVYGTISRITALSRQLIQSLCEGATPKLTQEHDPQRKAELMKRVDRLNAWVAGAWYGAMFATIHPFLGWLMKADWNATPAMIALVIARTMVISMSVPHSYGLISGTRFKEIARACQRELVLMVVLALAMGHYFGELGVATGVLFSTWGASLWYLTYQYFRTTATPWLPELIAVHARGWFSAALGWGVATVLWRAENFVPGVPGWSAMLAGGIGFIIAVAFAYAFAVWQSRGETRTLGIGFKMPVYW